MRLYLKVHLVFENKCMHLYSNHTHTQLLWRLELLAHIYIMEQFYPNFYPLIHTNNNVVCVYDQQNMIFIIMGIY